MRTGKVSPGEMSRLGTDTEALPPGVTSWASTISVIPRMRRWLELRSESEVCKSRTTAPPRGNGRDWPQSAATKVTGESLGKSILNEPRASAWPHANVAAQTPATIAILLRIDIRNCHLARVGINVAGPHRSTGAHHHDRHFGAGMHHRQR